MTASPLGGRFLQIHTLHSYGATLLNRDQEGFAKRISFGGSIRLRVSSQCLKRHWRTHQGAQALSSLETGPLSIRSRVTFRDLVRDRLVRERGTTLELATLLTEELVHLMLGETSKNKDDDGGKVKGKKKKKRELAEAEAEAEVEDPAKDYQEACRTNQITVLGQAEVEYLYQELGAVLQQLKSDKANRTEVRETLASHFTSERRKNLHGLVLGAGLDAALFGRMVTSRNFDNIDAAIQVAHSLTVHGAQTEMDFFSAVDDLEGGQGNKGSGHIGTTELTSGLYYGYVTVDLPLLYSNLSGRPRTSWEQLPLSSEVLRRLITLIATVSPGAKLGSTAPHAYAQFVLIERGDQQPRSLANAFLKAVPETGLLLQNTYQALTHHLEDIAQMFGPLPDHRFAAMGPVQVMEPVLSPKNRMSLDELAAWASSG